MPARQPKRAASLHAKAVLAFAKSWDDSALPQARSALNILLRQEPGRQVSALYNDLMRELTKHGMKSAAEALTREFGDKIQQSTPPNSRAA